MSQMVSQFSVESSLNTDFLEQAIELTEIFRGFEIFGQFISQSLQLLAEKTPYSDAVHANYQPNEEHIQEQNYKLELELRKLKRCL